MPDIHQGYGFPIGGVAAFAANEGGIISPGGIGYDINCGVRLLAATISCTRHKALRRKASNRALSCSTIGRRSWRKGEIE